MAENTEEEEKKNPLGAKTLSKVAMTLAGLWVIVGSVLKGLGILQLSVYEVILSGIGAVIVWVPTYASIYMDKMKEIKGIVNGG